MKSSNAELIAQLTLEKHHLEKELRTDDVTGLGNLKSLKEELHRRQGETFGVLFVDVDHFKLVNEEHGHMAATGVLKDLGALVGTVASMRGDRAFRYAGDEFVLLVNGTHCHDLIGRAEELRHLVENRLFKVDGHQGKASIRLTVSIGTRARDLSEPVETILSDADKALFEAKRKSRNVSVAYTA